MIFDTNALSALAAREPSLLALLDGANGLALSFITVAEFRFGLLGSNRPEAGLQFLQGLVAAIPVLFPDAGTLTRYAEVADALKRIGRPIPQNDMWTAALALQYARPVLSKDRHFDFVVGLQRVDW